MKTINNNKLIKKIENKLDKIFVKNDKQMNKGGITQKVEDLLYYTCTEIAELQCLIGDLKKDIK